MVFLIRGVALNESPSCSREDSLDDCGCPCDPLSCLLFSTLWLRCSQSLSAQETQSAKDLDLTWSTTFLFRDATCLPVGPMSLDWPVNRFGRSDSSRPSLPPAVPSGEQQRGAFPASIRSRWRQGALQTQPQISQRTTGWDGCGPFLSEGLRCITWNTPGLVGSVFSRQRNREFKLNCLKKLLDHNNSIHGKNEFLQAVQEVAPQFRLFGTFLPDNENAGGSAICIHRDLLPEEAIVAHVVTCQGRDHLVNVRSGRHSLVFVNVHFEPDLTLEQLRSRLCIIHPHWPAYSCGVGVILGDLNICDREEGRFNVWNLSITDGDPAKTAVFHSFFPHVLEIDQSDYTRRDSAAVGNIRSLSRIDRIFINLPIAEARDFHCSSHVVENLGKKTIPSDHAAVRLVIQKPTSRRHQSKHIPSWMSKHPIFGSILQQLHDDHRFSPDPFCALAEFKVLQHKAKKITKRELSRQTPDCIGAKLLFTSAALRAYRNRHLGTPMRCYEAWKPIEDCFDTLYFECIDFQRLSQIFASVTRENLQAREAEVSTLPWTQTEKNITLARCRSGQHAWRNKSLVLTLSAVTDEEGHPLESEDESGRRLCAYW